MYRTKNLTKPNLHKNYEKVSNGGRKIKVYFILLRLLHLYLFNLILLITSVNFTNKVNLNFTRYHQLQDTIPQHCGESTGRRSEWVLLQVWKNTINISWNPHLLPPALQISEDDVRQGQPVWTAGPHLHADLQQITGAVWSPFLIQTLHHHPVQKKPKITGLNYYRPVVTKSFEKLVLAYLKDITGPLLDPLKFAFRANRSVDDAVNMGLYIFLQHLDRPHSKKCWVKYSTMPGKYWTEHMLGCFQPTVNPTFWAVTQPLGKNNPIAGFIHILPSAGLYLT